MQLFRSVIVPLFAIVNVIRTVVGEITAVHAWANQRRDLFGEFRAQEPDDFIVCEAQTLVIAGLDPAIHLSLNFF